MVQKVNKIWMNGEYVNWDDANIHILTHTLHYGVGAFEGVRCYQQHDGSSAFFRLREHMQRLNNSAEMMWLKPLYTVDELINNAKELYKINNLKEGYLRPLIYVGTGAMGLYAIDNPLQTALIAWPWGAYLGDDGVKNGIRAKVSSFNRLTANVNLVKAKACGNYINSILAKREAMLAGYQEAIMMDAQGYLAEASGENLFIVKNGVVRTTPAASTILNGITRDSAITLLKDAGIEVLEQKMLREEAYIADEIFLTGTAAEITPVREIDHHTVGTGKPGPITQKVQQLFKEATRGKIDRYKEWLEII